MPTPLTVSLQRHCLGHSLLRSKFGFSRPRSPFVTFVIFIYNKDHHRDLIQRVKILWGTVYRGTTRDLHCDPSNCGRRCTCTLHRQIQYRKEEGIIQI